MLKRINKEYNDLTTNTMEGVSIEKFENDPLLWRVTLRGP